MKQSKHFANKRLFSTEAKIATEKTVVAEKAVPGGTSYLVLGMAFVLGGGSGYMINEKYARPTALVEATEQVAKLLNRPWKM